MLLKLGEFLKNNKDEFYFTGGISIENILDIEKILDISLSNDYKEFLKTYGILLGFGVEILGCGKSGIPSVVRETKRYREFGLPCKYIVIRNADEWIYCLDIMQGTVVSWDSKNKKSVQVANSFDEYLYMAFSEAKESWEE